MKILTKVLSVVLIFCFSFVLCIVPVFALPASSTSGIIENYDYVIEPSFFCFDYGTPRFHFIPLSPGTGLFPSGQTYIDTDSDQLSVYISSSASSFSLTILDSGSTNLTGSLPVYFGCSPFLIDISDFPRLIEDVGITGLDTLFMTYSAIDIDDSSRTVVGYFTLDDNITSYYRLGDAEFADGSFSPPVVGATINDVSDFTLLTTLGYDRIAVDRLEVYGTSTTSGDCSVFFGTSTLDDYYSDFEWVTTDTEVIYEEQPDLVAWIYDVLQGLFDLQIFGDVSLGTLLLVAISVPLLVSMLKAIAGG